jgi:hypothetical protein
LVIDGDGISKFWKMNAITNKPAARIAQMELKASSGVSAGSVGVAAAGDGVTTAAEFRWLDVLNAVRLPRVSDNSVSVPGAMVCRYPGRVSE